MKVVYKLKQNDVAEILSKNFDTNLDSVYFYFDKELQGYGLNAQEVTVLRVEIEVPDKKWG